jgi:hypothetical protein
LTDGNSSRTNNTDGTNTADRLANTEAVTKPILLELTEEAKQQEIVSSFVFDPETDNLSVELNHRYSKKKITSPIEFNWPKTIDTFAKELGRKKISQEHILMLCDVADNAADKILRLRLNRQAEKEKEEENNKLGSRARKLLRGYTFDRRGETEGQSNDALKASPNDSNDTNGILHNADRPAPQNIVSNEMDKATTLSKDESENNEANNGTPNDMNDANGILHNSVEVQNTNGVVGGSSDTTNPKLLPYVVRLGHSDRFACKYCSIRDDKWGMIKHYHAEGEGGRI